jgi:hypothetical protein
MRHSFLWAALFLLATTNANADIYIGCGGYDPSINDHVEWDLKISGKGTGLAGKHFSVLETRRFFFLTGSTSQIRINKVTKRYMIFSPKGPKAPAIE